MNLIGDPWIPVLDADGKSATVGLRELYERAHEIRDLALQPPQRIAVTRLLLCITHATLDGPEDEDDWRAFSTCADRLSVGAPVDQTSWRKRHRIVHSCVDYQGVLQVTNRERFHAAYRRGIGPAKAFGFGLLLLRPLR